MTVEPIIALWRSISPLFQGLSVAVAHILTLKLSHCFKTFLENSPPWSTKLFLGYPKTPVQCCNTFLTINSFFFVIYHVTQPIFFHYETTHLGSWLWFHFNFQPLEYWSWFVSHIQCIFCISDFDQHVFLFLCRLYYIHLTKKAICHYVDVKIVSEFSWQFYNFSTNDKFLMLLQIKTIFDLKASSSLSLLFKCTQ